MQRILNNALRPKYCLVDSGRDYLNPDPNGYNSDRDLTTDNNPDRGNPSTEKKSAPDPTP